MEKVDGERSAGSQTDTGTADVDATGGVDADDDDNGAAEAVWLPVVVGVVGVDVVTDDMAAR